jgi:hypothetical protein
MAGEKASAIDVETLTSRNAPSRGQSPELTGADDRPEYHVRG